VRIVEVEEYFDAKSDDTIVYVREEKRYCRSSFFPPQKQRLFSYAESHDGKKKEKTGGSKRGKILFSLHLFVGQGFCLADEDTLFGEKSIYWCN